MLKPDLWKCKLTSYLNNEIDQHQHLVTVFIAFRLFPLVMYFNECILKLPYLHPWVLMGSMFSGSFLFISCCFLNFMLINLLITQYPGAESCEVVNGYSSCSIVFGGERPIEKLETFLVVFDLEWNNWMNWTEWSISSLFLELVGWTSRHVKPHLWRKQSCVAHCVMICHDLTQSTVEWESDSLVWISPYSTVPGVIMKVE